LSVSGGNARQRQASAINVSDGSCRSAVSSWPRYRDTLSSNCLRRRSIFAHVKFLSRLFTALNLLPSIATLAFESRPIRRHSSTNRAQTFLMAPPLGGGSCTKLRNATTRSWAVGYDDDQQPAALCSMRFVRRPVQRHRYRRAMLDPRMFRRAA